MIQAKALFILLVCMIFFSIISCVKNDTRESLPVTGTCSGTPGPLFSAVKTLVAAKCVSCHNSNISNGGMNFSSDCNIVTNQTRIKVRAVDQGNMPPTGTLPQFDKNTITNWINAGGKLTN